MIDAQNSTPATPGEILQISHAVEGEVMRILVEGKLSHPQAEEILRQKGAQSKIKLLAGEMVKTFLGVEVDMHAKERESLQKFFKEVLNETVDLSETIFPKKQEGFAKHMVIPSELRGKEDLVAERGTKKFGVGLYRYQNPIAKNIDRGLEQKRPEGSYAFAHRGGDEPDIEHLGKSYDDAMSANIVFANPLEYLLMTLYHKWLHDKWMDVKGWTRTSSLWSDGGLVSGSWNSDDRELELGNGYRDYRGAGRGPRQLVL